jgi:hypothetical protein
VTIETRGQDAKPGKLDGSMAAGGTTEKPQEEYWDSSRPGLYVRFSQEDAFFFSYYRPIDNRKRSLEPATPSGSCFLYLVFATLSRVT